MRSIGMDHLLNNVRTGLAASLMLGLAACAATGGPPTALTPGEWGGQGVALTVTADGAGITYDCAAGTIAGALRPDAAGRFRAEGTHTPSLGGPERLDVPRPSHLAVYSGQVRGPVMTLSVTTPATGTGMGPFRLRRGAPPTLHRCL